MSYTDKPKSRSEKLKMAKKRPSNDFETQLMAADNITSSSKKKRHSNERNRVVADEDIDQLLLQDIVVPPVSSKNNRNSLLSLADGSPTNSYQEPASSSMSTAASTSDTFDPTTFKKQPRMKVYAGRRKTGNEQPEVPSLLNICQRYLQNHIDLIDEVGITPFNLLSGVFDRCTTDQLDRITKKNPQFLEDLNPIWERHVRKSFPTDGIRKKRETWYDCYKRLREEQAHKLRDISARIKSRTEQAAAPVRSTKMTDVVQPLRMQKKQMRNGIMPTISAPDARQVSHARREIFHSGSKSELLKLPNVSAVKGSSLATSRPSSSNNKAAAPKVGALMAKSMKMLKNQRRR